MVRRRKGDGSNGSDTPPMVPHSGAEVQYAQWVQELDWGGGLYANIERLEPRSVGGKQVSGYIDRVYDVPTADYLKQNYGGGHYAVHIHGPKADGKGHRIYGSKRIRIAGDPKLPEVEAAKAHSAPADGDPTLAGKMADHLLRFKESDDQQSQAALERERQRYEQERLRLLSDTSEERRAQREREERLEREAREERRRLEEKLEREQQEARARLEEVMTQMRSGSQQENNMVLTLLTTMLQQQNESTSALADREKERDRIFFQQMLESQNTNAKAQMDLLTKGFELQVQGLQQQLSQVQTGKKAENPMDMLKQSFDVLQMARTLSGDGAAGGDADAERSGIEKAIEAISRNSGPLSDIAQKAALAIGWSMGRAGGGQQPQQPQPPALPNLDAPYGAILGDPTPRGLPAPRQPAPAPQQPDVQAQRGSDEEVSSLLRQVLPIVEEAYNEGGNPESFAVEAADFINGYRPDLLTRLREIGTEDLLNMVGNELPPHSTLQAPAGRTWIRHFHGRMKQG